MFICRADDVASSSTFPSRAVYIREPIWLYKTRQRKGGGPEAERGETWKPFYGAAQRALDSLVKVYVLWRTVEDIFGVITYECSTLTNAYGRFFFGRERDKFDMRWVKVVVWDGCPAFWSWNGGQ